MICFKKGQSYKGGRTYEFYGTGTHLVYSSCLPLCVIPHRYSTPICVGDPGPKLSQPGPALDPTFYSDICLLKCI